VPPPSPPAPVIAARRLRTAVLTLLLADAVVAWIVVVGVYTLLQRLWLGLSERVLGAAIETHVAQLEVARRLQGVLVVATAVVFLVWVRRAHRNLRLLGVERLGFTPRAATAAFIVPIMNLVAPVRVVRELWLASRPEAELAGARWWEARVPAVIPAWWALVVVWQAADPVWQPLTGGVEHLAVGGSTFLFVVAQLAALAAALLGAAIVWTIDAAQARHFAALEDGTGA
jgi:hypothetical protein